ncbi:MAG: lyase family protein, partial [Myxococcota bacterium]
MTRERNKPWGGRFRQDTDPNVEQFSASIDFDRALARYDLRLSLAHAEMLGSVGLLSAEDLAALRRGLAEIGDEIESGRFPFDASLEDIHMNVERRLVELAGPVGGKLHTGRSRND